MRQACITSGAPGKIDAAATDLCVYESNDNTRATTTHGSNNSGGVWCGVVRVQMSLCVEKAKYEAILAAAVSHKHHSLHHSFSSLVSHTSLLPHKQRHYPHSQCRAGRLRGGLGATGVLDVCFIRSRRCGVG